MPDLKKFYKNQSCNIAKWSTLFFGLLFLPLNVVKDAFVDVYNLTPDLNLAYFHFDELLFSIYNFHFTIYINVVMSAEWVLSRLRRLLLFSSCQWINCPLNCIQFELLLHPKF